MARLTNKQQAFVDVYVETLNATEAAARAGYKGTRPTLAVVGHQNLNKPDIALAIREQSSTGVMQRHDAAKKQTRVKVYLMRAENGLIKIGKTITVEQRLRQINMMSPVDIELFCVFDSLFGDELEKELHAAYACKRVKGEWFALSQRDLNEIVTSYGPVN